MSKAIAIIVGVVNIIVLLISSIVLMWMQSQISSLNSSIQRKNDVLDKVIDQQRMANTELNFAFVHISALAAVPNNSAILSNAGMAYFNHLQSYAVAGYDEEATDHTEYSAIQAELQQIAPRFSENFYSAINESAELKDRVTTRVTENIRSIMQRRDEMISQKDSFQSIDAFIRFAVSGLQFLSLFLLLIRELFSKPSAKV